MKKKWEKNELTEQKEQKGTTADFQPKIEGFLKKTQVALKQFLGMWDEGVPIYP